MTTRVRNIGLAVAFLIAAVAYFWASDKPPPADQQQYPRPSPALAPPIRDHQPGAPNRPPFSNAPSPVWPYRDAPGDDRSFPGTPYPPGMPYGRQTEQRGWNQSRQWGQPSFSYPYQTPQGDTPETGGYRFRPQEENRKGRRWTGNFGSPSSGGQ